MAVAANFREPMSGIITKFESESEHRVLMSVSSSGKLYAQIVQGAPYDLFFSADSHKPRQLEKLQRIVTGSRFVYAKGSLVLFSTKMDRLKKFSTVQEVLLDEEIMRLAIANPKLAPYGEAARQALLNMGVYETLKNRLVYGENINQTMNFVIAGGVDLGLVALSQVIAQSKKNYWVIPEHFYQDISQEAVMLKSSDAARDFLRFFRKQETAKLIESFGYRIDSRPSSETQ